MYTVTNDKGRKFNVCVIFDGDAYGRSGCLTHEGEPVVEFYDATYGTLHGPRGNFVSSYYFDTIANIAGGINLYGGVPEWELDTAAVADAVRYAGDVITMRKLVNAIRAEHSAQFKAHASGARADPIGIERLFFLADAMQARIER